MKLAWAAKKIKKPSRREQLLIKIFRSSNVIKSSIGTDFR